MARRPDGPRSSTTPRSIVYVEQFSPNGALTPPLEYYRNLDRNWEHAAALPATVDVPGLMVSAADDPVLTPAMSEGMEERVPNLPASDHRGLRPLDPAGAARSVQYRASRVPRHAAPLVLKRHLCRRGEAVAQQVQRGDRGELADPLAVARHLEPRRLDVAVPRETDEHRARRLAVLLGRAGHAR